MRRGVMALLMAGALLAASTVAFAQVEQGAITGTVVDKAFTDGNFGRITTGAGERRLQIGIRLWF